MNSKFFFLFLICCITSCNSLSIWGYKNLGDHYFLWEGDHYKYSIIWCQNENKAEEGGTPIINLNKYVVKYNFNNQYIIAKTIQYRSESDSLIEFWIIIKKTDIFFDKNHRANVLIGPLDSSTFSKKLIVDKIAIRLIEVPKR